ncbi:MAG: FAD-dependent oxidoreductase [Dehalococcoidales bacterium]|nr:FAD-dependent oxidoreductase [Dehalococcoidales bacterium]
MSRQNNIIIIGGTACGPKAAARARRLDSNARITIIEQRDNLSSATCGLPYFLSGVVKEGDLIQRDNNFFRNGLKMTVFTGTRAVSINPKAKSVEIADIKTDKHQTLEYDRLVIATGATPTVPNWEGKDLKGIFTLSNIPDAVGIRRYVSGLKNKKAVIVGAGLIGLEAAENLVAMGLKVTVLEMLGWPLPTLLDKEIAFQLEKHLKSRGIKLMFGQRVTGFKGDKAGKVNKVMVGDTAIDAGMVLLSLGVRPNVSLAKEAGLKIGTTGGIAVNEYLQTSDPDIYAGGDCAEMVNIVTGKKTLVPMGSTANKHGRVIGTNVTGGKDTFPGVVGTGVVKVFDLNVGRTGLNEAQAKEAGYDIVTSLVPSEEHATYYPGAKDILVKLVAEKVSGRLLGGQVIGRGEAAKRTDVLATALTMGATMDDVANLDLGYAPPYNSAMDPLHHAANVIRNKQAGYARAISPQELKRKLDKNKKFVLLDVRFPMEWKEQRIETPQTKLLPLPELYKRMNELDKDDEIVIYCKTSIRAYQAQRILNDAGYKNVYFVDGSLDAWPYETASNKQELTK